VSLLRLGTKATLPDSPEGLRRSANLYFCISALACLGCALLYSLVPRLASVQRKREAALAAAMLSYGPLPEAPPAVDGEGEEGNTAVLKEMGFRTTPGSSAQQQVGLDLEHLAEERSSPAPQQQQWRQAGEAAPLRGDRRPSEHSAATSARPLGPPRPPWRLTLANGLVFV